MKVSPRRGMIAVAALAFALTVPASASDVVVSSVLGVVAERN